MFYRPVVGLAGGHVLAGCGLYPLAKLCGFLVYLFFGGPDLAVLRFGGSALRDHFCWAWRSPWHAGNLTWVEYVRGKRFACCAVDLNPEP